MVVHKYGGDLYVIRGFSEKFHIFSTSGHIIVAFFAFVVGEYLRHQTIDLIKIALVPERMIWRLHETIQPEAIDLVKVSFHWHNTFVIQHAFHELLVISFVGHLVEIVLLEEKKNNFD